MVQIEQTIFKVEIMWFCACLYVQLNKVNSTQFQAIYKANAFEQNTYRNTFDNCSSGKCYEALSFQ